MPKLTKKQKQARQHHDLTSLHTLSQGAHIVKATHTAQFDASVDLSVNLGIDPKKENQIVRGTVTLPHGTGKTPTILVLCTPDKTQEALDAGADHAGLDDYLTKIADGWTDIDIIIAQPSVMPKLAKLGRIIGPKGLMPNPKTGTVTPNVAQAVQDIKAGKITFKVDKYAIIHASIGRTSFTQTQIQENAQELINTLQRLKPTTAKGTYIKTIHLSSTMGPGIRIHKDIVPKT